jgi:hypothetical protein
MLPSLDGIGENRFHYYEVAVAPITEKLRRMRPAFFVPVFHGNPEIKATKRL